jgi:hypothetical protein
VANFRLLAIIGTVRLPWHHHNGRSGVFVIPGGRLSSITSMVTKKQIKNYLDCILNEKQQLTAALFPSDPFIRISSSVS